MASEDSGEESAAGGGAVSSASEDSGQASPGSGIRNLSASLSVNLSDDCDVQLAEAALQLASSSLGSRRRRTTTTPPSND